jgi:hypothetical protein
LCTLDPLGSEEGKWLSFSGQVPERDLGLFEKQREASPRGDRARALFHPHLGDQLRITTAMPTRTVGGRGRLEAREK